VDLTGESSEEPHRQCENPFIEYHAWVIFLQLARALLTLDRGSDDPVAERWAGMEDKRQVCHFDMKPGNGIFILYVKRKYANRGVVLVKSTESGWVCKVEATLCTRYPEE
jgi:hypothetical protein